MANENLTALIQQAAAAAAQVPEHLQQVAFVEGFRFLSSGSTGVTLPAAPSAKSGAKAAKRATALSDKDENPVATLINAVDRSEYPEVVEAKSVLDRSLHILRIAETYGIDGGLTPPQIARVLRDKFRVPTDRTSVSTALSAAPQVDRRPAKSGYTYTLTAAGEAYLTVPREGGAKPETTSRRKRRATPKASTPADTLSAKTRVVRKAAKPSTGTKSKRNASATNGRLGPKAFLEKLINDGFFKSPKMAGDVIRHASAKLGYSYSVNELAPTFLRLLREGALDRRRNEESKQYEYLTP
ncbi:MAG: hypothetical protein EPO16_08120 [Dehalococcoidia bacterium]|nr:MAG: hypothetical protein EPO16_08120 [Dehalococcoidia bacterium]